MSVDDATVRKIARLARIKVDAAELPEIETKLNTILGWIEQLSEVDTTGVAPMTAVIPNHLAWRADLISDGDLQHQVLANAPDATSGFFAVPKVIE